MNLGTSLVVPGTGQYPLRIVGRRAAM